MILQHKHYIGRFEVADPPHGIHELKHWMRNLISAQSMIVLSGPHVEYVSDPGNRGLTGVAIIKTSHCAIHVWDEPSPALIQLDFYTCGELDIEAINTAMAQFRTTKVDWMVLDREIGLLLHRGGIVS